MTELSRRAAWVPNSNSLLPVCFCAGSHKFAKRCKPVFGKLRRLLIGDSHATTGAWQKKAVLYRDDAEWRKLFTELLCEPDVFWDGVFDHKAVCARWDGFLSGKSPHAYDFERLVQLKLLGRSVFPSASQGGRA
jgi:hypothetical protein